MLGARIDRWLLGLWLLALPSACLRAQTDTTYRDTMVRPAKAGIGIVVSPDSFRLLPATEATKPKKLGLVYQSVEQIVKKSAVWAGEYLPHKVERDGKTQVIFRLPSHEFYAPWPKALEPNTGRPPYDPGIAWQRAVIFPGMGQAYNRRYWKMPFVYLGYGGLIGWTAFQNEQYKRFNTAFLSENPDLLAFGVRDREGLRTRREEFRRGRDFGLLFIAGWHLLQTVEAYVDSHMRDFDVSEDLTFTPALLPVGALGFSVSYKW